MRRLEGGAGKMARFLLCFLVFVSKILNTTSTFLMMIMIIDNDRDEKYKKYQPGTVKPEF